MKYIILIACLLIAPIADAQHYEIIVNRVTVNGATNNLDVITLSPVKSSNLQDAVGNVQRWIRRSINESIRIHKAQQIELADEAEANARRAAKMAALEALENEAAQE